MIRTEFTGWMRGMAILMLFSASAAAAQTAQEHVHRMSPGVMPFALAKTIHIFRMSESGGVQRVIAKDPAAGDQIALIQRHLAHEAERFARGDYADPASLHGADMPGLQELQSSAAAIKVSYAAVADGGEITFATSDLRALTAIHRWFGAQLSEHGADARAE